VILPPEVAKEIPKNQLMTEAEWRSYGVTQSRGWVHYAIHRPEVLLIVFSLCFCGFFPLPVDESMFFLATHFAISTTIGRRQQGRECCCQQQSPEITAGSVCLISHIICK
jgi:hypothetical protein